jgi:hypothetical protein
MAYYVHFHHRVPVLPPSHALSRLARRRPRRLRWLSDAVDPEFGLTTSTYDGLNLSPSTPLMAAAPDNSSDSNYFIPGSTFGEILDNALTGTLTQGQSAAIQQNETSGLIQAGMNPSAAATQAQSDVNTVLTMNNAAPSQAWSWASLSTLEKGLIIGGGGLVLILILGAVRR